MEQKIGWIGTGVMGKSMGAHLLKAGYKISVYNRSKEKANGLNRRTEFIVTGTDYVPKIKRRN